eukprot:TRINITY_DN18566_c0_g2_i1.p1 TRINITY_DN18566_c0_g2~~TRINITY_DN18566_c0_g2_i1.p1  ORF type:complete len:306 (-),score=82.43 TRINITY_DN18566_c0_g2_i1:31-948(-)
MVAGGAAAPETRLPWRECSTLSWCVATLLLLYAVGGAVFSSLEREAELDIYKRNQAFYTQMRELYEFDRCGEPPFSGMDFCHKQQEFNSVLKEFLERGGTEMEDREKWTFFGSAFYVTTLVTTLGYGNLHPQTSGGQLFTVIFGIVGIPAMGYVLSRIGQFVVEVWMPACPLTLETRSKRVVVLWCLMLVLVLSGGALFSFLEGWSFLNACYFSTCTLLTVGFGDLLPGRSISRMVTVVFIFAGLGVAASLVALLQIHVEIKGEHFAKKLDSWYGAMAGQEPPDLGRSSAGADIGAAVRSGAAAA